MCLQNRIILEKFIYGQSLIWSRNSLSFMELVGLVSHLQEPGTGPYPELVDSSPHTLKPISFRIIITLYFVILLYYIFTCACLPRILLLSDVVSLVLYTFLVFMCATCLSYLMLIDMFTTVIIHRL